MNNSNFSIKGFKTWSTYDGGGYQFTLYLDGKKFAFVHNDGNGGEVDVDCFDTDAPKVECISTWDDKTIFKATPNYALLHNYVRSLPKWKISDDDQEHNMTMGIWIDELVNQYEQAKKLAKAKKKGITFRLNTDSNEVFRTINTLDMQVAMNYLNKKFGINNFQLI